MPKYRVEAKTTKLFEIYIDAKNEEEAWKLAGYFEELLSLHLNGTDSLEVGFDEVYNVHEGSHDDD
tara:strand:- start:7242 stop:7439 length:198 start_codon:yes stop_codon:yes gene_type:complete